MALALRQRSFKPVMLFPFRSEAVVGGRLREGARRERMRVDRC